MRRVQTFWLCFLGAALPASLHAQGFAALVSPPRFELASKPGKTLRSVIEISNRSTTPGRYLVHTADWELSSDFSVTFHDDLRPDSCRPWVAIERPEIVVPGAGTQRYRFEVTVPADAAPGECRFAVMIEGADPSIARSKGLDVPVTGRIGVIVYVIIGDGAPDLEVANASRRCGFTMRGTRMDECRDFSPARTPRATPTISPRRTSRSCRTRSARFFSPLRRRPRITPRLTFRSR